MERKTTLEQAKEIMGNNFIGPVELKSIEELMGIFVPDEILVSPPEIPFNIELLEEYKNDYILILGIPYYKDGSPLTIVKMREHFGSDPNESEPCFYNQDWYLNEYFANICTVDFRWYLIGKEQSQKSKGVHPFQINSNANIVFPPALLLVYAFFAFDLLQNKLLWASEYIWCADTDTNDDQIYIGRYVDPKLNNKNGLEIHRHLKIKNHYGAINFY